MLINSENADSASEEDPTRHVAPPSGVNLRGSNKGLATVQTTAATTRSAIPWRGMAPVETAATPLDVRQWRFKWRPSKLEKEPARLATLSRGIKAYPEALRTLMRQSTKSLNSITLFRKRETLNQGRRYRHKSDTEVQMHNIAQWAEPTTLRERRKPSKCSMAVVLIVANLALVAFSVGALTGSALQAAIESTRPAFRTVADNTLTQIIERVDGSLFTAQSVAEDAFSFAYLTTNFTSVNGRLGHVLYYMLAESQLIVNGVHVSSHSSLVGFSRPGNTDSPASGYMVYDYIPEEGQLAVYDMNPCPHLDTDCELLSPGAPRQRSIIFTPTDALWYEPALNSTDAIWTDVYMFPGQTSVGVTTARAFYSYDTTHSLMGVSSSDIRVTSFNDMLYSASAGLGGESSSLMFVIMLDSSGYLLGTSKTGVAVQKDASGGCTPECTSHVLNTVQKCCMYLANEHPDDEIRSLAQALVGYDNTLWTSVEEFYYDGSSTRVIQLRSFNLTSTTRWVLVGTINRSDLLQSIRTGLTITIPLVGGGLVFLAVLGMYIVTRLVARPISIATEQMYGVSRLDFTAVKRPPRPFIQLAEMIQINTSLANLRVGLASFGHYVPRSIVQLLLQEQREAVLGLDETDVTIMFADITDFSDMTENMASEDIVRVLSEYLEVMMGTVQASQGLVDKFMGDILMAFWNAPTRCSEHRAVAIRTALTAQERLAEKQADWTSKGFPQIRARFGIHAGVCLVGNLGSPDRLSFTCIGDSVNLASRLNGLNKMFLTNIITSGDVRDAVRGQFTVRPLDVVAVKGKSKPVVVIEVLGEVAKCTDEQSTFALTAERAFSAFLERRFDVAVELFGECSEMRPGDVAVQQHLRNATMYLTKPPPPDWNGVRKMMEK